MSGKLFKSAFTKIKTNTGLEGKMPSITHRKDETMTVKELRETLAHFPEDLPVCLADWNERYADPCEVGTVSCSADEDRYQPSASDIDRLDAPYILLDIERIER